MSASGNRAVARAGDPATAAQRGPLPPYLPRRPVPDVVRILAPTGDRLWLVTRFALGRRVLADPGFSRAAAVAPAAPAVHPLQPDPASLTSLDPPAHSRLRALVSRAFIPHAIAALEDGIRAEARGLLRRGSPFDLVRDYTMPLAAATICRMLGVPEAERDRFAALADLGHALVPCTPRESATARAELRAHFVALLRMARRDPGEHLLGALVRAHDEDGSLSEAELIALVELLLNAGYETTIGQTGLAVLALLEHPGQWRRLVAGPGLVPGAVEELLRFAPVVPISFTRLARTDTELAGEPVRAGEAVLVSLLHANFDPRAHPRPGALSVDRTTTRHVSFGHGPHICLGAQLARLQLRIALEELVAACPRLALAADPATLRWRPPEAIVRGPTALPVSW
ncbi:cytochrome P450 [Streptomyces sp. NA02950]|uniref:cytochrome P450 n=1 Tax=Streptomyces sp. NA02950 TaxID=2742137 RepID=UPI001590D457|nr:cytochrome P450 [Streptomyces sp. NA02950]QKV96440.1 cytochrome P450 [Streptomyces sp. NA02950]